MTRKTGRPAPENRPRTGRTPVPAVHVHREPERAAAAAVRGLAPRPGPATEAEIRDAIRDAIVAQLVAEERAYVDEMATIADNLDSLARQAAQPLVAPAIEILEGLGNGGGWEPLRDEPLGLWHDLRPSEALELRTLVEDAIERAAKRCEAAIVDELAAAALSFGDAHPELPVHRIGSPSDPDPDPDPDPAAGAPAGLVPGVEPLRATMRGLVDELLEERLGPTEALAA